MATPPLIETAKLASHGAGLPRYDAVVGPVKLVVPVLTQAEPFHTSNEAALAAVAPKMAAAEAMASSEVLNFDIALFSCEASMFRDTGVSTRAVTE
ncbi:hypothetical protein D3C71_2026570 [compost metagenome]